MATAEKIRSILQATSVATSTGLVKVSASFGVAALTPSDDSAALASADLLKRADEALYRGKLTGRNRVVQAVEDRPSRQLELMS
jgi:diguanylate cyclase (GGDEF)-like protein